MIIRSATHNDCETLTEISFSSKSYWDYPKEYFQVWEKELTITKQYVDSNFVQVAEDDRAVVGYYSVVVLEKELKIANFTMSRGIWLEHVFIQPELIGRGYGKQLMQHLLESARRYQWDELKILADPHSKGFYEKLGANYIREVESNIPGRTVSYFEWITEKS